jgi:hypothetical protein
LLGLEALELVQRASVIFLLALQVLDFLFHSVECLLGYLLRSGNAVTHMFNTGNLALCERPWLPDSMKGLSSAGWRFDLACGAGKAL